MQISDPASGLTIEYAYSPGGAKYSYTPELRGRSFNPPTSDIGPSDNEFYAAVVAQMAKIEEIESLKKILLHGRHSLLQMFGSFSSINGLELPVDYYFTRFLRELALFSQ